jgi:hypothetical protein
LVQYISLRAALHGKYMTNVRGWNRSLPYNNARFIRTGRVN